MFTSKRNDVEPMAALLSFDTTYKTYLWKVCVEARESTESNSTWKAEMPSSKHELRVCVYLFFFYLFIFLSVWNVTHRTTLQRTAANWMCLIESSNTKNSRRGLRDESTWSTTVEDRPKIY